MLPSKFRHSYLIWTFAESYLTLTEPETKQYEREIARFPQEEQEATMQMMTSFRREGIQQGMQQGLHDGKEGVIARQIKRLSGYGRAVANILVGHIDRRTFGLPGSP